MIAPATTLLLLTTLLTASLPSLTNAQPFSDCAISTYYSSTDVNDRASLHALIQSTHRNVLPYTSSFTLDVWDALIDLDGTIGDNGESQVSLLYSNRSVASLSYQESEWNREHVWPKSLGVGTSGPDYTDLHHVRPADANVNSARGNKLFGECGIADIWDDCKSPAHDDAANDTATDNVVWLPPADKRGDVARIMFYMVLRYEGDASNELDLQLTDCIMDPETEMGYLSQLLKWHVEDPVDDIERERNANVCESWQGNRNPFVDYENLVTVYFGEPREPNPGGLGYTCDDENNSGGSTPPVTSDGTCNGLQPGDVMITAFHSDNPDVVAIIALNTIAVGATLFMTDNAWTGTTFRTNEGTLKFVAPSDGIPAQTELYYGDDSFPFSDSWSSESGSFALAASGDTILLYCMESDDSITHISALSFSGDWLPASNDESTFGTEHSALPDTLPSNAYVALPHYDNYWYAGPRQGSLSELQESLSNPNNWQGSNTETTIPMKMNGSSKTSDGTISTKVLDRMSLVAGVSFAIIAIII